MNTPQSTDQEKGKQFEEIESFLNCLFAEMGEGEEIPFWASRNKIPGFPKDEKAFLRAVKRDRGTRACYFGCSTMFRDGKRLLNRQTKFAGYYVVVLDDVGTGLGSKVTPSGLPSGLSGLVTYRIETSPDNEQWGFALDHPIRDLELAKAFQREIVNRCGSVDIGGMMPNKLVRMPCGVNLKDKYEVPGGGLFECKLLEFHPDRWNAPGELLSAVDAGITWAQLEKRASTSSSSRKMGTTAHRKKAVYQASLEGVVDPVLEWLNETDQIVSERGEWVDILCPWASDHTEGGGNTAGYAPIGMGAEPDRRGFHCFHDSCSAHHTSEFLAEVLAAGGPRSSPKSPIEALVCRYAFDMESNRAIDLKSPSLEVCPHAGFKNQLTTGVWVPDAKGNMKSISEYTLYMAEPNRMRLAGCENLPGAPAIIPSPSGGYPRLNLWRLPGWGDGSFDENAVKPFEDFLRYLMPEGDDADWFLDHLAAKAQDPHYRGAGVIMHTPVEGTGRATLGRVINRLWGSHNTASVTLKEFLIGSSSADNNSWIVSDWIIVSEGKDTTLSAHAGSTAYEVLKGFIEPGSVGVQVKEKYAIMREVECFGCTIICSNHADVLPVDSGGTRLRRIANTVEAWPVEKFRTLYAWLESGFEPHVWRWLRARDLSKFDLRARQVPPTLEEDNRRALDTQRGVDAAIGLSIAFAERENQGVVFLEKFVSWLDLISEPLGLDQVHGWRRPVRRELANKTREPLGESGRRWRPRYGGKAVKIRTTVQPRGIRLYQAIGEGRYGDRATVREVLEIDIEGVRDRFLAYCRAAVEDVD